MNKEHLNPLKKIEELTSKVNNVFAVRGKSVFEKYPLVFALLVITGATLMSQGIKSLLFEINFLNNNPLVMFLIGLLLLIITGTLYKKLDK